MRQDMHYVYQVYIEGSFSKAAEKLYLTQPALSIAIQKIEAAAGMPLFDRSSRPLKLTPAGQIYIDTIQKTQWLEQEMEQRLEDVRGLQVGSVRMGGSHYLNAYILPDILKSFGERYPHIQLQLLEHSSAQLTQMLAERQLDLTFNCNEALSEHFERYLAFSDRILLAVPKEHPVNQAHAAAALSAADVCAGRHLAPDCPTVALQDFAELEFILMSQNNNLHDRCYALFQEAGVVPKVRLELSQLVTAYHLASHAVAATFVSDRMGADPRDNLCYYKLDAKLTERLFYILLPKRSYTSLATRAFVEHFQAHMRRAGRAF